MLATCVIAGKIVHEPVIGANEDGRWNSWMILETERPFRNPDGSLDRDQFLVYLWRGIAEECRAACGIGSWVVARGRLETKRVNGTRQIVVIAEKVSYLRP